MSKENETVKTLLLQHDGRQDDKQIEILFAEQCGYLESGAMPKFSLCSDSVKWFQDKGQFRDGSYVPAAGDIIFFDWGYCKTT